jgi:hypothetical protein
LFQKLNLSVLNSWMLYMWKTKSRLNEITSRMYLEAQIWSPASIPTLGPTWYSHCKIHKRTVRKNSSDNYDLYSTEVFTMKASLGVWCPTCVNAQHGHETDTCAYVMYFIFSDHYQCRVWCLRLHQYSIDHNTWNKRYNKKFTWPGITSPLVPLMLIPAYKQAL